MGFCLFNSVAVAARYALESRLVSRVLIVDWDIHHGNGTQDIFYRDPDVFYLSMHQSPFYPGTGARDETGEGPGEGTTLNLPMPPGLPPERYVDQMLAGIEQAAAFDPELVLISAGFDAGAGDVLGGFTLREDHFCQLTSGLEELTRSSAGGRIVSALEGGYNPEELGRNVVAHIEALTQLRAGRARRREQQETEDAGV
jgi:acetoin utilization deacetylase AcuC-like enzyme